MRDYVTTVFNLIVGLIDADKIVYIALIGLGLLLVWQLLSLLTNFHRKFAGKCRKISKFLTKNGLSADNYNAFLALVAKMPQEFIRGYKTFEHASYGLPSDYIKRFDSIDVEVNGGILNHGKSLAKAMIYGWTLVLFMLSLALLGNDTAITGFALADALLIPILFLILAKIIYFIFNAIKQQQYKMAVDEFNEMLDIMNDKIENNDSMPGPDVLTELMDSVPVVDNQEPEIVPQPEESVEQEIEPETTVLQQNNQQPVGTPEEDSQSVIQDVYNLQNTLEIEKDFDAHNSANSSQESEPEIEPFSTTQAVVQAKQTTDKDVLDEGEVYTEEDLIDEVTLQSSAQETSVDETLEQIEDLQLTNEDVDVQPEAEVEEEINNEEATTQESPQLPAEAEMTEPEHVDKQETTIEEQSKHEQAVAPTKTKKKEKPKEDIEEEEMEEKRGRGRPKKVAEGELVIKNDKQFEEVLQRAEKLMRKSEEALSSSQAKRVEKSLKELIDAMTKYKEEH